MDKKKATKSDWKTIDMPKEHDTFSLERKFSAKEIENLKFGNIPKEMEDKWFWYFDNNKLYCHRSWTGFCVYIIEFNFETNIHKVIVNRCKDQYIETSIEEDKNNLNMLLNFWVEDKYNYYNEWLNETAKNL